MRRTTVPAAAALLLAVALGAQLAHCDESSFEPPRAFDSAAAGIPLPGGSDSPPISALDNQPTLLDLHRLEQTFAAADEQSQRRMLYEWTFDPRRELRTLALELMRRVAPDEPLRFRVGQLADTAADPVIRGYARLLAADWSVRANPPHAGAIRRLPLVDEFGVARASFDTPVPPSFGQPDFNRAPAASFEFQPVTPFWQASRSRFDGVPADAGRVHAPLDSPRSSPFSPVSQPGILDRPIDAPEDETSEAAADSLLIYQSDAPLGFTGPSGVLPTETQQSSHFVPVEDRWRIGFPSWDRYERGFPLGDDYPYKEGSLLDPYNQNVLKGDFPIIGQHTFFALTVTNLTLNEYRQTPTPTTPFESTNDPFQEPFFGDPNQYFFTNYVRFAFELFHGNEAFKPMDWKVLVEPVFNVNHLDVQELGVVNPDVRRGTNRTRTDFALEAWFAEAKLADISPDYDFISVRAGSQPFVSDFRGFLFKDINRGVRLFGTRLANRDQFNLIWLDQLEKDTNSELNTFRDRHQNIFIANYFRQDFIFPGYTAQLSFHYNRDQPSFLFDDNDFLVRPDPTGVFREHEVEAYYIGWAGDGHIGRVNVTHQFYVALGHDTLNPLGNEEQDIFATMAAIELSYDRDWIRFRTSYFFASGDDNPDDHEAGGFDTILDDPIFAGGEFSYWQRQAVRLFGVNLVQRKSLVPNLRSSKIQGQSNFVNPGLHLINVGMDFEVTPKLKVIANANYLFFDHTAVLEHFVFQDKIGRDIGTDLSIGVEWRPLHNDNIIFVAGSAVLIPARGLEDLFSAEVPATVAAITGWKSQDQQFQSHFLEMILQY